MAEHKIFAKCAWRLIPFMALLFVVNYIDRTNAGFAAGVLNDIPTESRLEPKEWGIATVE